CGCGCVCNYCGHCSCRMELSSFAIVLVATSGPLARFELGKSTISIVKLPSTTTVQGAIGKLDLKDLTPRGALHSSVISMDASETITFDMELNGPGAERNFDSIRAFSDPILRTAIDFFVDELVNHSRNRPIE